MTVRFRRLVPLTALLMAGCAVGPRYVTPAAPTAPVDAFKEAEGWKRAQPSDETLRGAWWEIFGDDRLNALEQALAGSNEDLKAADARFREARALIGVSRSAQSPTIAIAPAAAFVRNSGNTSLVLVHAESAGDRSCTRCRSICRTKSTSGAGSARASRRPASARRRARPIGRPLPSACRPSSPLDYFELRSADAQRRLLDAAVAAFSEALQLTTNRFEGGAAARSDVTQAKTQLEATRVQATDVAVQRARYEHAIATLLGQPPSALSLAVAPLDGGAARHPRGVAVAVARAPPRRGVGRASCGRGQRAGRASPALRSSRR